jgi:hypothetical protein
MRRAARTAAARFTWSSVLDRVLFPLLRELGVAIRLPPPALESIEPAPAAMPDPMQAPPPMPEYLLATAGPAVHGVARP